MRNFIPFVVVLLVLALNQPCAAQDTRSPTVGAPGRIEDLILPGSELAGRPIEEKAEMIVRVVKSIPHGDGYRYQIQFFGLEAGKYDLAKWLVRKDGSSSDDLPEINVEIQSLLPPGQVTPNELEMGWIPQLGGYKVLASIVAILWLLGLLGLILLKRKRPEAVIVEEKKESLADLLIQRLIAIQEDRMQPNQYAELERMLFGLWRRKLELENIPTDQAMARVRQDEEAGPLMRQIEEWMHSPNPNQDVDLGALVKPYRDMPADAMREVAK